MIERDYIMRILQNFFEDIAKIIHGKHHPDDEQQLEALVENETQRKNNALLFEFMKLLRDYKFGFVQEIKETIKWFLIFTASNLLLGAIGQLILFFLSDIQGFEYIPAIVKNIFIQCLLFSAITLLTMKWIGKKHYYLVFPLIVFLLLNLVFLFNLELIDNKLKFITSVPSISYDCYYHNASMLTDILNVNDIIQLEGTFDGGLFYPYNTVYFYVLFAITSFVYYTVLTCLSSFFLKKYWQR